MKGALIKELAKKLAINYVDVSLRVNEENSSFSKVMNFDVNRELLPRSRNILIIGAGASLSANSNLNTAKKVANVLEEKLVGKNEELKKLLDEEKSRLSNIYTLDGNAFETELLAFIKFFPKKVRKEISRIFHSDFRYFPNLFYEVIAHLFKHRFIDVIINFNFDELLDQIIAEEMADTEYYYIYSDGHCPKTKDLVNNHRFKKPIYIKPHGTASHASTLRFTREAYEELPHDIYELLNYLVSGKTDIKEVGLDHIPVNLISAGFAMESFEFNQILASNLEKGSSFYHINPDEFQSKNTELTEKLDVKHIEVTNKLSLDDIAKYLWKYTSESFIKEFKPKGIGRHIMANHLFNSEKNKDRNPLETITYAEDRILFEIFIATLNNEGIISLEHLVNGRVGIYFNLLKSKKNRSISLHSFIEKMGLSKYKGHVRTTYILEQENCDRFDFASMFGFLYKKLTIEMSSERKLCLNLDITSQLLEEHCDRIYSSNLKNLTPKFRNPHFGLFTGIKSQHVINTNLLWSYRFRELLQRDEDWDVMLVISETGGVLSNLYNKKLLKNKSIFLVTATEKKKRDFQGINIVGNNPKTLPWWIHNRHMVLFVKEITNEKASNWREKWKLYRGIYYTSRFSNRVNPVYIKNKEDLETMLSIFGRYWFRANSYNDKDSNPSIRITRGYDEIDDTLNNMINEY